MMHGRSLACLVVAALSLSGLRSQDRGAASYREVVEHFRSQPDAAIERLLELPDDAVSAGISDAIRPGTAWSLASQGAALLMHTDAALFFHARGQAAGWAHIDRALQLADALARDPESTWLVHQWFGAVTLALKGDDRTQALIDRWHAESWYAATSAMDRGLVLEAAGSLLGSPAPARGPEMEAYDPNAFRQAAPLLRQAVAAHLEIAAVHLGRIEMLRGHETEARRLFGEAADNSHWRTTTYLANLFLGSLEERDDDRARAERRYRMAIGAIGEAQSGRLALAAFFARLGRSADAAHVLAEAVRDDSPTVTFDPWWSYLYPYWYRPDSYKMILGELHMAVGR